MFFIDTTFILGLILKKDQWHDDSVKLSTKVKKSDRCISNIILLETLNGLAGIMNGKEIKNMYYLLKDNYNVYYGR